MNGCASDTPDMCAAQKRALRTKMRASLTAFCADREQARAASEQACRRFLASPLYAGAETVLAFLPCGTEIDTVPLVEQARADGKRVALPRIYSGTCDMDFYYVRNDRPLEDQCPAGSFGIREPREGTEKIMTDCFPARTAVVVPGLAFSESGQRLGKGKGFYDRYFARISAAAENHSTCFPAVLAGFCFPFQIVAAVPCNGRDVKLTHVVSADRIVTC